MRGCEIGRISCFLCLGKILKDLIPRYLQADLIDNQGCIFCLTCSYPELIEDHVLTSAYVKIFRTVTRNAVNKSVPPGKELILAHYL